MMGRILLWLAGVLLLLAMPADAQQIEKFAVSSIETFDHDENFLGEVDVSGINPKSVQILDKRAGMLQVKLRGDVYWIYDSDVILAGRKSMKDCPTRVARAADSQTTAIMGLGC